MSDAGETTNCRVLGITYYRQDFQMLLVIYLGYKKKLIVFSGPPSSVLNAPLLSFFQTKLKKYLIHFFRCQNQTISIFMPKMNKKKVPH